MWAGGEVAGAPWSPGLLPCWALRPGPPLSGPSSPGRGGCLLHTGARDPAAQGAQAESAGRGGRRLHELQVPVVLTATARRHRCRPRRHRVLGGGRGRKEVPPEPGQPRVGGQSDRGPPRTLCTDCRELKPPAPQCASARALSRPAGCRFHCSKLFDGLDLASG